VAELELDRELRLAPDVPRARRTEGSRPRVNHGRLARGSAVLFAAMATCRDKVPRSPRLWTAFMTASTFLVDGGISGAYVTPL
jgi:hypothetical protein